MTPAQLDQHIASLGMALADAHANGDTEGARAKLAEMHAAHSPRSIVIGSQSDEGKRGRMRRRSI
jgi:hypothetical protein